MPSLKPARSQLLEWSKIIFSIAEFEDIQSRSRGRNDLAPAAQRMVPRSASTRRRAGSKIIQGRKKRGSAGGSRCLQSPPWHPYQLCSNRRPRRNACRYLDRDDHRSIELNLSVVRDTCMGYERPTHAIATDVNQNLSGCQSFAWVCCLQI